MFLQSLDPDERRRSIEQAWSQFSVYYVSVLETSSKQIPLEQPLLRDVMAAGVGIGNIGFIQCMSELMIRFFLEWDRLASELSLVLQFLFGGNRTRHVAQDIFYWAIECGRVGFVEEVSTDGRLSYSLADLRLGNCDIVIALQPSGPTVLQHYLFLKGNYDILWRLQQICSTQNLYEVDYCALEFAVLAAQIDWTELVQTVLRKLVVEPRITLTDDRRGIRKL